MDNESCNVFSVTCCVAGNKCRNRTENRDVVVNFSNRVSGYPFKYSSELFLFIIPDRNICFYLGPTWSQLHMNI